MHSIKSITEVLRVRIYEIVNDFKGAIVVFDFGEEDSIKKMSQWVQELRQYLPNDVPIVIAGNKSDLNTKAISEETAQKFARQVGSEYFSTSAKTGAGVNDLFERLAESNHKFDVI